MLHCVYVDLWVPRLNLILTLYRSKMIDRRIAERLKFEIRLSKQKMSKFFRFIFLISIILILQDSNVSSPVEPKTREPHHSNGLDDRQNTTTRSDSPHGNNSAQGDIVNCDRDIEKIQLPASIIACLDNCAICVKQWRSDVYNGQWCADDCMKQTENLKESMDLDCNSIKYFNTTIIQDAL